MLSVTRLCKAFDEWYRRDLGKVLVNHFETLVAQHLGLPAQNCIHHHFCGKGVAVEHDGSVYSCDHYVYPEYRLGNLREQPLADMVFSPTQVKFGYARSPSPKRSPGIAVDVVALKGEGGLAAQGVPLLDRRRQRRGAAVRQLQGYGNAGKQ